MRVKPIDWNSLVDSIPEIKKIIKKKIPLGENPNVNYVISIKDKHGNPKDVHVLRGIFVCYYSSLGISTADCRTQREMSLSFTMQIGDEKEAFIITASNFKSFINFDYHNRYEVVFIDNHYLRIKKIS